MTRDLLFPAKVTKTIQIDGWHRILGRRSPLHRPGASYSPAVQQGKVANVKLAARRFDGVMLAPGDMVSWHRTLGPPLAMRGFRLGPELHCGQMAVGLGGGVCQVANMLFWLGLHGGLSIVERHRHSYDLFPDQNRDVPFGCGATVFYPNCDLKLRNTTDGVVVFRFTVCGEALEGSLHSHSQPNLSYRIVERQHRFVREKGIIWRENSIYRQTCDSEQVLDETLVVNNRAKVCYPVSAEVVEQ